MKQTYKKHIQQKKIEKITLANNKKTKNCFFYISMQGIIYLNQRYILYTNNLQKVASLQF